MEVLINCITLLLSVLLLMCSAAILDSKFRAGEVLLTFQLGNPTCDPVPKWNLKNFRHPSSNGMQLLSWSYKVHILPICTVYHRLRQLLLENIQIKK